MKKKITAIVLALGIVICLFAGCSGNTDSETATATETDCKLNIVCTMFPMYDWVQNILGDKAADAQLTMLLDSGADLHSYQPTAEDILKIAAADVFIYVGGESDKWIDEVKSSVDLNEVKMFSLLENLGEGDVVEEETVEGMEAEVEEAEEGEEEEIEYDEHVWLSLDNAANLTLKIAEVIEQADAENAETYAENANTYASSLTALSEEYAEDVKNADKDTLVVADRFPFRYLCKDYDIKYYAAFSGCSAESEAAFSTITFLAEKANELKLNALVITETSDGKIAETVRDTAGNSDLEILTLNAMQSVTAGDLATASYYETMKTNLDVLIKALS